MVERTARRAWADAFMQGLDRVQPGARGSFVKGSDFIAAPSPPETSVKHSLATLGISSVK